MTQRLLESTGLVLDARVKNASKAGKDSIVSENPAAGEPLAAVSLQKRSDYDALVKRAITVQEHWRRLPAPKRGEIVRLIGNAFRDQKESLGELVSLEVGKIRAEGLGEIQECIDIA